MRIDVAEDTQLAGIRFDRPQQMRRRHGQNMVTNRLETGRDGKSSYKMTDDVKRYWFVVAVFRGLLELAATIEDLRANNFTSDELIVIADRCAGDVRKTIHGSDGSFVDVFVPRADGAFESNEGPTLPLSLANLLRAMRQNAANTQSQSGSDDEQVPSPVYAQLLKDVEEGAIVLVASASGPEQQLQGARILLRGKCECVLTHELTERVS